jgi:hypothetical protein
MSSGQLDICCLEPGAIVCEQGTYRLFEARQIARHRRHEAIGGLRAVRCASAGPPAFRASSTSLRSATEAPPGCAASHSQ